MAVSSLYLFHSIVYVLLRGSRLTGHPMLYLAALNPGDQLAPAHHSPRWLHMSNEYVKNKNKMAVPLVRAAFRRISMPDLGVTPAARFAAVLSAVCESVRIISMLYPWCALTIASRSASATPGLRIPLLSSPYSLVCLVRRSLLCVDLPYPCRP